MEKQKANRYARAAKQTEAIRCLYSKIGQPLPVDIIIDLHRHLGKALELADEETKRAGGGKRRFQA